MLYFVAPPNVKSTDSLRINMLLVPGENPFFRICICHAASVLTFRVECLFLFHRCGPAPQEQPAQSCPALRSEFIYPYACLLRPPRANDGHSLLR